MNMILHGIEAPNIVHTNTLTENLADIQEKDRFDVVMANPPFGGHERKEIQLFESQVREVFVDRREEWAKTEKPLVDLCELIVDCEHKTAPTQEEGIPSIRTPNIGRGRLLL